MLIRSQNKEYLCNIKAVYGVGYQEVNDYKRGKVEKTNHEICVDTGVVDSIGVYSTKEKALKVLDMIEQAYCKSFEEQKQNYFGYRYDLIFHMPKDEEVEE